MTLYYAFKMHGKFADVPLLVTGAIVQTEFDSRLMLEIATSLVRSRIVRDMAAEVPQLFKVEILDHTGEHQAFVEVSAHRSAKGSIRYTSETVTTFASLP